MVNDSELITVEVAYALPQRQLIIPLQVAPGTTAQQAIEQSGILQEFPEIDLGILQEFPEIDLDKNKIGIFARLSKKDTPLKAGDRVEIYRPLIADPKEVRRQREAEGKRMKKGGGDLEPSAKDS